jgi:hypothetical protein
VTARTSASISYETTAAIIASGRVRYEIPAAPPKGLKPAPATLQGGAPPAALLTCPRCNQPSAGGGLCEACEDALTQLRTFTAAILQADD